MRRILPVMLCIFLISCSSARETPPPDFHARPPEPEVSRRDGTLGAEFAISKEKCEIRWTVLSREPGVVSHRAECALAFADQVPLMGKILESIRSNSGAEIRLLDWGRLFPDGAGDASLPARLAVAAKRSPEWDVRRGIPRGPDINATVRRLANGSAIYEELRELFGRGGQDIEVAYVEKVLVAEAGKLPFFERLKTQGIAERDKVPFDCQVWLSVRPRVSRQGG